MRPVLRGASPIPGDYDDYQKAKPDLMSRLGSYCSYCERRIAQSLAVEHIQPKDENRYPHLVGRWDNFLLACTNCNSTKLDKDVRLDQVVLPDRDNSFAAYEYTPDGKVIPSGLLSPLKRGFAEATLSLTGLDKRINAITDENGKLVAIDRVGQRMEMWLVAEESLKDLQSNPSDALKRQILRTALESGFFSIWMVVFSGNPSMRQRFIDGFSGTDGSCFDQSTVPVSPRVSALPHGGKV